jgi:hypothetical protein
MTTSIKDFTPKTVRKSGKTYHLQHVTCKGPKAAMEFIDKNFIEDKESIIHSVKSHGKECYGIFVINARK